MRVTKTDGWPINASLTQQCAEIFGDQSNLISLSEFKKWLQIGLKKLFRKGTRVADPRLMGTVPLYFPSRVRVIFLDGSQAETQLDLPYGSLAAPQVESLLRIKFMRDEAEKKFDMGLALESVSLAEFLGASF